MGEGQGPGTGLGRICRPLARGLRPVDGQGGPRHAAVDEPRRAAQDYPGRLAPQVRRYRIDRSREGPLESSLAPADALAGRGRGLGASQGTYLLATLSNGNISLLADMAKSAGLPWDVVLSAELFHHYKPDREVYLGAADLLGCKPAELIMVAAHAGDLQAAQACGLDTAFVPRPLEYGPTGKADAPAGQTVDRFDVIAFDMAARDFLELAAKMASCAR